MNKTVKILIVVIVVIVLAASGAIGYFVMKQRPTEVKTYIYDPETSFITNVQNDKALVKSTLVIQVTRKKALTELAEKSVIVSDSIIDVLRQKTKDEMLSDDIQEQLKMEICGRIAKDTGIEGIDTIYFSEFVVQQ